MDRRFQTSTFPGAILPAEIDQAIMCFGAPLCRVVMRLK
jgi:hypothetical protein